MVEFDFVKMRAAVEQRNARVAAERDQALTALDDALGELAEAKVAVSEALLDALDMGVPEEPLRTKLGVSHATFWRRIKAAREGAAA
jgi:hypothetical protein